MKGISCFRCDTVTTFSEFFILQISCFVNASFSTPRRQFFNTFCRLIKNPYRQREFPPYLGGLLNDRVAKKRQKCIYTLPVECFVQNFIIWYWPQIKNVFLILENMKKRILRLKNEKMHFIFEILVHFLKKLDMNTTLSRWTFR